MFWNIFKNKKLDIQVKELPEEYFKSNKNFPICDYFYRLSWLNDKTVQTKIYNRLKFQAVHFYMTYDNEKIYQINNVYLAFSDNQEIVFYCNDKKDIVNLILD